MPDWFGNLADWLKSDVIQPIVDWKNRSPLEEDVYPSVAEATTFGSGIRLSDDRDISADLQTRLGRLADRPDVQTRALYEALSERPQDYASQHILKQLREKLHAAGATKTRGNLRAFGQALSGGQIGYGDTFGFGTDRIAMPTEQGEGFWGTLAGNLPGAMAGSLAPFLLGPAAGGARAAQMAAQAPKYVKPALQGLSSVARTLLTSEKGAGKLLPPALWKRAGAWGLRDASSALSQDWETERYLRGMIDVAKGTPAEKQLNEQTIRGLTSPFEKTLHALGQGALGVIGYGVQAPATQIYRMGIRSAMKPVFSPGTIKKAAATPLADPTRWMNFKAMTLSGAPQAVFGAPAQQYHSQRGFDKKTLGAQAAIQMGTGGVIGGVLSPRLFSDLPEQYVSKPFGGPVTADPGAGDRFRKVGPVGEFDIPPVTKTAQDMDDEQLSADAVQLALLNQIAGVSPTAYQNAINNAKAATQYIQLMEGDTPVRYAGPLEIDGLNGLLKQVYAYQRGGTTELDTRVPGVESPRVVTPIRPSAPPLALPPGWEPMHGVARSGKLWGPVAVKQPDPSAPLRPGGWLLGEQKDVGLARVYYPADEQLVEAPLDQVLWDTASKRGLPVSLWREQNAEKYRQAEARKRGANVDLSDPAKVATAETPLRPLPLSPLIDANPNFRRLILSKYDQFVRLLRANTPPASTGGTTPPIARGPARGGRNRP